MDIKATTPLITIYTHMLKYVKLSPRHTLLFDRVSDNQHPPSIRLLREGVLYDALAVRETTKKVYDLERMEPELRASLEDACVARHMTRMGTADHVVAADEWRAANELHKGSSFVEPPAGEMGLPTSSTLMYLTLPDYFQAGVKLISETPLDGQRIVLRLRTELAHCCFIHGIDRVPHTRVGHIRMVFAPV